MRRLSARRRRSKSAMTPFSAAEWNDSMVEMILGTVRRKRLGAIQ